MGASRECQGGSATGGSVTGFTGFRAAQALQEPRGNHYKQAVAVK